MDVMDGDKADDNKADRDGDSLVGVSEGYSTARDGKAGANTDNCGTAGGCYARPISSTNFQETNADDDKVFQHKGL